MEWISVEDRLPEYIVYEDGSCNSVLALSKEGHYADYMDQRQVVNTAFFNKNKYFYTHWATLPELPPHTV